jgi:hypothetical protein
VFGRLYFAQGETRVFLFSFDRGSHAPRIARQSYDLMSGEVVISDEVAVSGEVGCERRSWRPHEALSRQNKCHVVYFDDRSRTVVLLPVGWAMLCFDFGIFVESERACDLKCLFDGHGC